jgi:hypothetical protein
VTSCGSNHHPPKFPRCPARSSHGTHPAFAFEGEFRKLHVSHRRPEIMGQNAARNRERQWRVDLSMRLG